jgi:ribose transport system permease protein
VVGQIARSRLRVGLESAGRIWIAVVVLYALSGVLSSGSLQIQHVLEVVQVASFLGVVAVGQTLVMLTGGIDLSVAGVITVSNIVSAGVMDGRDPLIVPGVLLVLVLGVLSGLTNGLLITKARITPLIATLAMNSILFGGSLIYSRGAPHGAIPGPLRVLGQGHLWRIPVSAVVWVVVTAAGVILTKRTVYGRRLYVVGANPQAARLAGIAVDWILVLAYMLSGLSAAVAGLLLTAFIGLPSLGIGDPYLLSSIAAVVVGGTALTGGIGSVAASAGGSLFMTQLMSLTNILNVSTGAQFVIQGGIIAASMVLNVARART